MLTMKTDQADLLTESIFQPLAKKRRQLLPWWINVFMWLFLVAGAMVPVLVIVGMMGNRVQLALYGLETNQPFSIVGICILSLFMFKGITSYGLLMEKNWAIKLGITDSIIGIFLCIFLMIYPLVSTGTSFRLELAFLVPYLFKLLKIKSAWDNTTSI